MSLLRVACGAAVVLASACGGDPSEPDDQNATITGRVIVAGPLREARISIDQLRVDDAVGDVRVRVGDTTTAADGTYTLGEFGKLNGLFRVTASGGNFTDLVSGETIVLDPGDEIRTLITLDLFEQRTDALVSPVGHLVATLAVSQLEAGMHANLFDAREAAADHIHGHFGDLDWQRIDPASLAQPASSATDPVRAALIADAFSILSDDIATAASASHQEVNAHSLMKAWAADLAVGPFDGNDGNDRMSRSGVQLGECAAVPTDCIIRPPAPACSLGACRAACDQYAGSPRSALSGALLKLVRSSYNQTGITDTATLPLARAIADNTDPVLFGDACLDSLDRTAPTLTFEAPSPASGAYVRGTISVRVRAVDDIDPDPDLAWLDGLSDSDGDPTNAVATAEITTATDGPLMVEAEAVDSAGNAASSVRVFVVDNTAPVVTLDPAGFYVSGGAWWTASEGPAVTGTVTEANLDKIEVFVGGTLVDEATVNGGTWALTLPAGSLPDVAGVDVRVQATDLAGGIGSVTQAIRYDATAPAMNTVTTTVRDETNDAITFSATLDPMGVPYYDPSHQHDGALVSLGAATACNASAPTITKHAYLLDEAAPPYVSESGGAAAGGANPILWRVTLTDDGVGIDPAQSEYQVRNATTGTVVLPWRAIPGGVIVPGGRDYSVPVYRRGSTWPSTLSLGTDENTFEISIRGRDLLGRTASVTRCWNQRLLPSPVYVGPRSTPGAASGNYGRYGFASLRLDDTVAPIDPISNLILNDNALGVGLMQFPVYNVATEPVFVAIDLQTPTGLSYQRDEIRNRWGETARATVNVNCGRVVVDPGPPVVTEPNESLPGCNLAAMGPAGAGTTSSLNGPISATYTVRVFEEVGPAGELVPCLTCAIDSLPDPAPGYQRVVVQLPARALPAPVLQSPRKFWIQPSIQTIDELRPQGIAPPFADLTFVGSNAVVAGKVIATRTGCSLYQAPATAQGDWTCTRHSTNTQYTGLTRARIDFSVDLRVQVRTSRDGQAVLVPDYFTQDGRTWPAVVYSTASSPVWNTTEALPPVF